MTSKAMRLRERSSYREAVNEVFVSEDPGIWIDRDGLEMSLGMAMDDVFNYITACFWMYDNPLSHLRRFLPGFIWKFQEDVGQDKFASVLGTVDYIWVIGLEVGSGFVTATQIHGDEPCIFCFLSKSGEYSGWNRMIRDSLRDSVPSIRFVQNGTEGDASTILS